MEINKFQLIQLRFWKKFRESKKHNLITFFTAQNTFFKYYQLFLSTTFILIEYNSELFHGQMLYIRCVFIFSWLFLLTTGLRFVAAWPIKNNCTNWNEVEKLLNHSISQKQNNVSQT